MKGQATKQKLLEQLKVTPIVQVACEKTGVSRATYYRWRKDDKEFAMTADQAIEDGSLLVNDMAESQLISAVRDKNMTAIIYWLRHHHPTYANTLQIKHSIQDEELTPEQEALVRKALELAKGVAINNIHKENNDEPEQPKERDNSAGTCGGDDQGQESKDSDRTQ